jgi:hypothetical protein
VRLDHLLSKEQLSAKADSSPRPANVRSGCSMAETLASLNRQRSHGSSTRAFGFGGTSGDAAGDGEKQASCWVSEGTTAPAEAGGPGASLGLFFNARHDLVTHTDC